MIPGRLPDYGSQFYLCKLTLRKQNKNLLTYIVVLRISEGIWFSPKTLIRSVIHEITRLFEGVIDWFHLGFYGLYSKYHGGYTRLYSLNIIYCLHWWAWIFFMRQYMLLMDVLYTMFLYICFFFPMMWLLPMKVSLIPLLILLPATTCG